MKTVIKCLHVNIACIMIWNKKYCKKKALENSKKDWYKYFISFKYPWGLKPYVSTIIQTERDLSVVQEADISRIVVSSPYCNTVHITPSCKEGIQCTQRIPSYWNVIQGHFPRDLFLGGGGDFCLISHYVTI